jgi:hypothetical protein
MVATVEPRVEIDERIRQQPELLRAVTESTRYLIEQAPTEVPPPAIVGWQYADRDGQLLQLTLSDTGEQAGHTVQRNYWTRWILDPVNQKLCVLRAWGELLGKRSDAGIARIARLVAELKQEELESGEEDAE